MRNEYVFLERNGKIKPVSDDKCIRFLERNGNGKCVFGQKRQRL